MAPTPQPLWHQISPPALKQEKFQQQKIAFSFKLIANSSGLFRFFNSRSPERFICYHHILLKQWFSSYFCFASAWLHQKSLTSDILIWLKNFHLSNPDSSWCYIISIFQVLTWVGVTQFYSPLKSHLVLLHNVHYPHLVDIILHSFESYPWLQCCTSSSSGVPHFPTYNILHYPCLQCTLSSITV